MEEQTLRTITLKGRALSSRMAWCEVDNKTSSEFVMDIAKVVEIILKNEASVNALLGEEVASSRGPRGSAVNSHP